MRRWRTWLKGSLVLALTATVWSGCGDPVGSEKKAKPPVSQADTVKARKIALEGEKLLKQQKFAEARAKMAEAEPFADDAVREEIRVARELIDEAEAKVFAPDIVNEAENGKCEEALEETSTVVKRGPGIAMYIRQHTAKGHEGCFGKLIAQGELGRARKLLASMDAKNALDSKSLKLLQEQLQTAVTAAVTKLVEEPLAERKWQAALDKIEEVIKQGAAGDAERAKVLELVRKGIAEDVAKLHQEGMEPRAVVKPKLDAITALLAIGWPATGADKPPAELHRLQKELSFALACAAVSCKPAEPQQMYIYGHTEMHPPMDPKGAPQPDKLKHGKPVWQLATGGGLVLISFADPGKLAEGLAVRIQPAAGWVKASRLKPENTGEGMPPVDSLTGTRVWGPLRQGQKHYELGTVLSVQGVTATVQRLTDREKVDVPVRQLRFGLIKKGTKVLAACESLTKLEPAVITHLKDTKYEQQGDPMVSLTCLDDTGAPTGKKMESQLASTRMDPKWLQ